MMQWYYAAFRAMNQFGLKEWMAILLALLAIGVFCMKGFGSRKDY